MIRTAIVSLKPCEDNGLCLFESSNSILTSHSRKFIEKLI